MKLLIDVGNTNTSIAVVKEKKIQKRYFIHTGKKEVEPGFLKRLLGAYLSKIDKVVMVSVVPDFSTIIRKSIRSVLPKVSFLIVGKDVNVPLKNNYKKPEEVGQDRLVTAYAAVHLYGRPVLIIDFGTAVTFDCVNRKNEYTGGLIFPGLRLGLESLTKNAALLPEIEVKAVKGLIGRDTTSSMNKGVVLGYAAMCDGIIKLFKKEYGRSLRVVATGGDAALITKHSKYIKTTYNDLVFEGLLLIT